MICHLANQVRINAGNMCYILSLLRIQLWANMMCEGFCNATWGTWHPLLIRFLNFGGEQPLNLFDQAVLGDALNPYIHQWGDTQQDAIEFVDWFRAQLFSHCDDGRISAGWLCDCTTFVAMR